MQPARWHKAFACLYIYPATAPDYIQDVFRSIGSLLGKKRFHRYNMRLDMAFAPSALRLLAFSTAVAAVQQPLPFVRRSNNAPAEGHKAEYATVLYLYLGSYLYLVIHRLILCCQIPIDHNDSSIGTYQNRYWVNEEHYTPGGPVFVLNSGESSGDPMVEHMLFNSSTFLGNVLEEFHGMGLVWEHRYVKPIVPNGFVSDSVDISADTMEIPLRFLFSKTQHQST